MASERPDESRQSCWRRGGDSTRLSSQMFRKVSPRVESIACSTDKQVPCSFAICVSGTLVGPISHPHPESC